jgi:hypothetical protein
MKTTLHTSKNDIQAVVLFASIIAAFVVACFIACMNCNIINL